MINLNDLLPKVLAKHLRSPDGKIGRAVADGMNKRNGPLYEEAIRRLELKRFQNLLEVGFGNGKLVQRLLNDAPHLTYQGIDISETMVAEAQAYNARLITEGRAAFSCAPVEALSFPDHSFDCVLAINVMYFWPDPVRALQEIRRVLRATGTLFVSVGNPETMGKNAFTQHGFRLYDAAQLRALHERAGFQKVDVHDYADVAPALYGKRSTHRESIFIVSRS